MAARSVAVRWADPPRERPQGIERAGKPRTFIPRVKRVITTRASMDLPVEFDLPLADARRDDRRGWGNQAIDATEERAKILKQFLAKPLRVDVIGGRDEAALVEQRQDVGAEVVPAVEDKARRARRLRLKG